MAPPRVNELPPLLTFTEPVPLMAPLKRERGIHRVEFQRGVVDDRRRKTKSVMSCKTSVPPLIVVPPL